MDSLSITKLLAKNFIWNLFGNLASKGSTFIVSIIAARELGVISFGSIGVVVQTLSIFAIFSILGLSVTAIKFIGSHRHEGRHVVNLIVKKISLICLTLSLGMAAIVFLGADYIANHLLSEASLTPLLKLASVAIVFNSINQIQFGILSGLNKFKYLAISNILGGIINIPIAIWLINQYAVKGFFLSLITMGALLTIQNRLFITKAISGLEKKPASPTPSIREIFSFAIPNVGAGIFLSFSTWVAIVLLTRQSGLEQVSFYNAANQLFGIIYLAPVMLAQVLMSFVANKVSNTADVLKNSIGISLAVTLPIAVLFSILSSTIMGLYGEVFSDYSHVLVVSMITVVMVGIITQIDHFAVGEGFVKQHFWLSGLFALLFIGLSFKMAMIGAFGIVLAKLIAYSIKLIVSFIIYWPKYAELKKAVPC